MIIKVSWDAGTLPLFPSTSECSPNMERKITENYRIVFTAVLCGIPWSILFHHFSMDGLPTTNCTIPSEYPEDFLTLSTTETENGVACIGALYPLHILLCYICVVAGLLALISRLIPRLKPFHRYFGRIFMVVMYFAEGSAFLIFNTGLPRFVIFCLGVMLFCMAIGYCVIRYHQERFEKAVRKEADRLQNEGQNSTVTEMLNQAKDNILQKPRKWYQRLLSLKAVHGYFMTVAWYQMAGRAGFTNPFSSWSQCYVYPVYKQLGDFGELVLLPGITDDEKRYQIEFATYITVPALIAFALIGLLYSAIASYYRNKKLNKLLTNNL